MRKLLFTSLILLAIFSLKMSAQYNAALENEKNAYLVQSNSRFYANLSGAWERSFDGENWETVNLPYSETNGETVKYRRMVKIDRAIVNKYCWQLYLTGIDEQVEVVVNGQKVGKYLGALSPFWVKIPSKFINPDNNQVELTVFSQKNRTFVKNGYLNAPRNYIGAIREIILVGTPRVWISEINYKTNKREESSNTFETSISASVSTFELEKALEGDSLLNSPLKRSSVRVQALIRNAATKEIVSQDTAAQLEISSERTSTVKFNLRASQVALWTPETPYLYELVIRVTRNGQTIDETISDLGFKTVSAKSQPFKGIYLNGAPFLIKGVDYFEDYGQSGKSLNAYQMEEDIKRIKTLGANVVRFKCGLPHPFFLRLCDKYGLMTMVELPLYDAPRKLLADDDIVVKMKNLSERAKVTYFSVPCALAFGISSGIQEGTIEQQNYEASILPNLKDASNFLIYKTIRFGAKQINLDGYDFAIFQAERNALNADYFKSELIRLSQLCGGKPFIANYGLNIQPDNNNGYADPLSNESQARLIRDDYRASLEAQASGSIIWSYNDFALEKPSIIANNTDPYQCNSGLVDCWRRQRLSFSALQSLFYDEKDPLLSAGRYSETIPITFIIVGIGLIAGLVFMFNRYRRFREYFVRALLRPYNFYADIRDQRILSTVQTSFLGAIVSIAFAMSAGSLIYFFRSESLLEYCLSAIAPTNFLREALYRLAWSPELLALIIAAHFYLAIALAAFLIRVAAFFVRARIYYSDTFTICIWSSIPLIGLLPFGMTAIRIFAISPYAIWFVALLTLLTLVWTILRALRSASVVFDARSQIVYAIGAGVFLLSGGALLMIYNYEFSIIPISQYFFAVLAR